MIKHRRFALLLGAGLLLAACSKQPSTESAAPGSTAPAASAASAASTADNGATMKLAPGTLKKLDQAGSETVEKAKGNTGVDNPLYEAVAAVSGTAVAGSLNGPSMWQEGVNYTRLVPAQPTFAPPGQVEVLEFFWYACPHCYALDPLVEAWRKTKAPYISFSRIPVMWSPSHRSLARLFYTLQVLGKLDQLHTAIFNEIHVNNDPLTGDTDAQSEQMQLAFVTKHGVSAADFKNAYHSFTVETDLQRADEQMQRYHITGVPTFVINGKYVADVGTAGGEQRLIDLVNDLAAIEHKH
ncbi:MAG: thiol:disulfide interchange protein DsbA/DsbL [Gammaproteobacteria bacterium]|nr:thiol:disulfide interchange protein DsbA/DsbL [Gammaproteobacteria bacterium]